MMTTQKSTLAEEVTDALRDVYDPEIPLNIVDLGLVYDVSVSDDKNVSVLMTLTAAGCGMGPFIAQQAEWAVAEVEGVKDVNVEIVFEPPWSPERISEDGKKILGIDD
jgi:metal-sulfur cluster biosynthetic enzyme